MYFNPVQIVDNLVYLNSDNTANLQVYYAPGLETSVHTNNPPARTKT